MTLITLTEGVKTDATEKKAETKYKLVAYSNSNKQKVSSAVSAKLKAAVSKVKQLTGIDLGEGDKKFGDTTREISSTTTKAGADTISWHKTGRAVDLNQGAKWIILEDKQTNGKMKFKLYLKLKSSLVMTAAEVDDDHELVPTEDQDYVVQLAKNGSYTVHYKAFSTYYGVNLVYVTDIFEDQGFTRIPAHKNWENVYTKREWWHYENRGGLTMYQALLEVYTIERVKGGYKGLMTTLSGRNKYGPRLTREGWYHYHIDKYVDPHPATGELRLLFPIGDGRNSTANHPWDEMALRRVLNKLGYYSDSKYKGGIAMAPEIRSFQGTFGLGNDGWMSVGGTTHNKFNSVFANKVTKGSHDTTLYSNVGPSKENLPADVKKVIDSLNICYDDGLCSAFMSSKLTVTTEFTSALQTVIEGFQQHEVGMTTPDGIITKGGGSHTKLGTLVDTAMS